MLSASAPVIPTQAWCFCSERAYWVLSGTGHPGSQTQPQERQTPPGHVHSSRWAGSPGECLPDYSLHESEHPAYIGWVGFGPIKVFGLGPSQPEKKQLNGFKAARAEQKGRQGTRSRRRQGLKDTEKRTRKSWKSTVQGSEVQGRGPLRRTQGPNSGDLNRSGTLGVPLVAASACTLPLTACWGQTLGK